MSNSTATPFICECGFNTMNADLALEHANKYDRDHAFHNQAKLHSAALDLVMGYMRHGQEANCDCDEFSFESYHEPKKSCWGINVFDNKVVDEGGESKLVTWAEGLNGHLPSQEHILNEVRNYIITKGSQQ